MTRPRGPRPVRSNARAARVLAGALCLATALGRESAARGDPPESEPTRLMRQGLALRKEGRNLQAIPYFQRAHSLAPSAVSAAQLGLVEHALGLSVLAERHLSEALSTRTDPWILKNRAALENFLAQDRAALGTLLIETSPATATVLVGGVEVKEMDRGKPFYVKPGNAIVEAKQGGFVSRSTTVTVLAGATERLAIRLEPQPASSSSPGVARASPANQDRELPLSPAPGRSRGTRAKPAVAAAVEGAPREEGRSQRVIGVALVSVGAAALAAGAGCMLIASKKVDAFDSDAENRPFDPSNDGYQTFNVLSRILFVAAGAALLGGGIVYWTGLSPDSAHAAPLARTAVAPFLLPGGAGLSAAHRF